MTAPKQRSLEVAHHMHHCDATLVVSCVWTHSAVWAATRSEPPMACPLRPEARPAHQCYNDYSACTVPSLLVAEEEEVVVKRRSVDH